MRSKTSVPKVKRIRVARNVKLGVGAEVVYATTFRLIAADGEVEFTAYTDKPVELEKGDL